MLKRLLLFNWMPTWARKQHPVVWFYTRQQPGSGVNTVIFGSTVLLFLLFGGLSLPLLYFLFSLISLMHIAIHTLNRLHQSKASGQWDILTMTSLPQGQMMLGMWAAGVRQQSRTLTVLLYRMLQGFAVVGVMIFGLWFGEIPMQYWLVLLAWGTVIIALQPLAELYLGGMAGLLFASLIREQITSLGMMILTLLITWTGWIAAVLWLLFSNFSTVSFLKVTIALGLPLVLPLILGYVAFQLAKRANR